jgi:gluconate kinase
MDLSSVRVLYDAFAGDRFTFLYSGLFHDEHTARLISLGEEFLEQDGAERNTKGKLAFIMVEAYQNIIRHRAPLSPSQEKGDGRSVFLLRSVEARHEVTAINPVTREDAERLTASLARLGTMDLQQMKQVFLRGLQNEERTQKGGAGLGLIEMARRSGHALSHGFAELDEEHLLFALQVLLGRSALPIGTPEAAFDLHRMVVEQGISVFYRGPLSAGEQEVVLRIIERDLDDDEARSDARTRAFLAATELLSNLGSVGEGPMVLLGRDADRVTLVVASPLTEQAAARMKEAVAEVGSMNAQALQRRYRDLLLGRGPQLDSLHLGLIELARRSGVPLRLEEFTWRGMPLLVLEAVI